MELAEYALMQRIESNYWWFVGRRELAMHMLRSELGDTKIPSFPLSILDVGCGTGGNMAALEQFGYVTGCDISREAIEFCRQRGQLRVFLQDDPARLPFTTGSFDLVTAFDVLEHVERDREMMAELYRILVPGGTAFLTVPAHPWLWTIHDESLHHQRRYTRERLRSDLAAAGFTNIRVEYTNGLLMPLMVPIRWLRHSLHPGSATSDFNLQLPDWLNLFFLYIFLLERHFIGRIPLPTGLSLSAFCRKTP